MEPHMYCKQKPLNKKIKKYTSLKFGTLLVSVDYTEKPVGLTHNEGNFLYTYYTCKPCILEMLKNWR